MTHPRKPPPNPETENMAHPQPVNDPLAPENVPDIEFIDMASNKPVDPTRFQVFELPRQFLEWVLSKEPPHLDPADMRDSAPHGLPIDRDRLTRPNERVIDCEPVPEFESTPVSPSSQPRISRPARRASSPPSVVVRQPDANPTIPTRVRRPTSLLTYLALTGKLPRRVVFLLGAVIGCLLLFLIMLWRHMDSSGGQRVNASESLGSAAVVSARTEPAASAVPLVPLADAPQPSEAIVDIDEEEAVTSQSGSVAKPRPIAHEMERPQSLDQRNAKGLATSAATASPKPIGAPSIPRDSEPVGVVRSKATAVSTKKEQQTSNPSSAKATPATSGAAEPTNHIPQDKTWFPED